MGDTKFNELALWLQRPLGIRENILEGMKEERELWFGRLGRVARAWSKQDNCGNRLLGASVHVLGTVLSNHPLSGTIKCPSLNEKPVS